MLFCRLALEPLRRLLSKLGALGRNHDLSAHLFRMAREVFTVIVLRRIRFVHGGNLPHGKPFQHESFVGLPDQFFRDSFLLPVMIEDSRTELCANVHTLLIRRRRVVDGEEDLQHFTV